MINNKYLKNIYYLTIFLINSLLIFCLIFKSHGITLGWDTQFHINRIEEIVKSLENGHLLPSHGTYAFSHIGLAVNYFYPYLFLYPFAILEILFNPLFGYNVTLLLMTFIGFIISYLTIKKLNFGDEQYSDPIAFWFSILYNNSSYIIFQSTLRGDIGEFIALILLPIVFLGFQMLYDKNTNLWVLLPVGLVLVAYSHLLSVFIFSSLLLLLFCIKYKYLSVNILKRLIISIIIFLVLVTPIIIPMILLTRSTKVLMPMSGILQDEALNPLELLTNSIKNSIAVSMQSINIGTLTIVVSVVSIIILIIKQKKIAHTNEIKIFFILGLTYTVLSTRLFPWFLLNNSPIRIIQFPWRLLGIATFCFAYAGALEFGQLYISKRLILGILVCINALNLSYVHAYLTLQPPRFYSYYNLSEFHKMATSAEYYDYMSAGKKNYYNENDLLKRKLSMYQNYVNINGKRVKLSSDQIHPGYKKMTYNIEGLRPGELNQIVLPLNNYGLNKSKQGRVAENLEGNTVIWIRASKTYKNVTITN